MSPRSGVLARRVRVLVRWVGVLALLSVLGGGGWPGGQPARSFAAPLPGPAAAPDNSITLQPFLTGLSNPVFVTHAGDGTGRLFVVEKSGRIKLVIGGQVRPTPFLDVTVLVSNETEQGLLGLAFHPQYETNGRFFIFYTAKPPVPQTDPRNVGSNTLVEYHVSAGNPEIADPTPVRTLLEIPDRYPNHNAGMIAFGSDGKLFISTGDEGDGGDPHDNAQNLGSLYGKILRIDVDRPGTPVPPGFHYAIPPDNPFFDDTDPPANIRQEIWAFGLRNPWRWSFDRLTGDMLVGDVGQSAWEEIDFLPSGARGLNFGWDDREGAHCYEPMTGCLTANRIDPILEYGHGLGCAVAGGYRYRGTANPALQGVYFYGDSCSGRIWKGLFQASPPPGQPNWTSAEALDTSLSISSFGEDEIGELYVVSLGGSIMRIVQAPPPVCGSGERPRVLVQSTRTGAGSLQVSVTATTNATTPANRLQSITFTRIDNAFVTLGTEMNRQTPFTVTFPGGSPSTQFTVRRDQAATPMTVHLAISDACGPWSTFVGGGVNMP